MPSHFSDPKLRIVSGSAPVATQVPHAVGAALAAKLRGLDEVAMTYVRRRRLRAPATCTRR